MGKIWMSGGGGGADLDVITAGAGDILAGKVIVDKDGEPLTGTMVDRGNWSSSELPAGAAVTIPGGKHSGGGKVTAKSLASQTPGTVSAGHILAGKTAWSNGSKITGTIPSQAGGTLTPSTSAVTANCANKYMTGNYTIPAFSLPPANALRKGYSYTLYGKTVTGTFEGYVTSPLYLYNNGSWNGLQTTGITKVGGYDGALDSTYYIRLRASASKSSWTCVRFNSSCDLTNYKYLKVRINDAKILGGSYTVARVGVSQSSSKTSVSSSMDANISFSSFNRGDIVVLDVSALNGGYYVYLEYQYTGSGDFGINWVSINQVFLSAA